MWKNKGMTTKARVEDSKKKIIRQKILARHFFEFGKQKK